IVQIYLSIIDSGCSKHTTGNRALLTNFVEKFLETVRFGNNDFTVIAGYGDVIIDSGCSKHMTGNRALLTNFVKKFLITVRFGNNDFAVITGYGDVVIRSMTIKKVYYVEGLGDRWSNLYTIALNKVASNSSTCLLANASFS
nr:integrase, catalytic region, zinc finger, CCHC-type, peptidase aspartic, catalytic [Tanacetum cinerariifolium]